MSRHIIKRTIERADSRLVDALGEAGTATVHEAIGRVGYVGPHLRPIQRDVRIAGSAVTVLSHPGDNIMIHAAVEMCEEGDILVVTNTAPSTHGMFGDLLAASLMARGVRGLVLDAGVRELITSFWEMEAQAEQIETFAETVWPLLEERARARA